MLMALWDSLNALSLAPCFWENLDMLFYVFYEYVNEYLILRTKKAALYEHSALPPLHFPGHQIILLQGLVFCFFLNAAVEGLVFTALMLIQKKMPLLSSQTNLKL